MQNYKKNFVTRTLAWVLTVVMVVTMLPMGVFAETYTEDGQIKTTDWSENARKEEETKTGSWPLSMKNRLVRVSPADPVKTPDINYIGVYTNADGREVVRLAFNAFTTAANQWDKLLIRLPKELAEIFDQKNPQSGIYKGVNGYGNHDNMDMQWIKKPLAEAKVPLEKLAWDVAGGQNVYAVDLDQNGSMRDNAKLNIPIDLVLEAGKSIKDFKSDLLVQARLEDKNFERVYMRHGEITNDYMQYTFSTIIPHENNYGIYLNKDLSNVAPTVPSATYNKFFSTVSSVKFNEKKGYLEVYIRQNKWATGEGYALRQAVESDFFNLLNPREGMVGEVYLMSAGAKPYSTTNEEPYEPTTKIQFAEDDIYKDEETKVGFIQIAGSEWDNTKEYEKGIKTKKSSNVKSTAAILNSTTAQFNAGVYTVVRYFIKPADLRKLIKDNGLKSYTFRSSFLRPNESKYSTGNRTTGTSVFTFTNDKERVFKRGEKVKLDFDQAQYNRVGATYVTRPQIIIGDDNYNIDFINSVEYDSTGKEATWTVPFDLTIKKGEKITVKSTEWDDNNRATRLKITFKPNDFKLLTSKDKTISDAPIEMLYSESLTGGALTSTSARPNVDEIFTDSKNITGHSFFDGAEINIKYVGTNGEEVKQTISAAGSTNIDPDKVDYSKILTKARFVNGQEVDAFPFDTTKPNEGGVIQGDKKFGEFKMPTLERDMPIRVDNLDVLSSFIPSGDVIEQVQTKFHFDLNGERSKTNLEVLDRIVPLSKEYKYDPETGKTNPNYKPSGFEGENVKYAKEKTKEVDGRTYQNILNHDGLAYDINNAKPEIAKAQKEAFLMRQMPTKDDVKVPQGKRIIGWTTKKLKDTADKTVTDQFNELKDANKVIKKVEDWANVDKDQNYIFEAESPIDKERTVYAVYGEGINIILHSNNTDDLKNETTITIPITISDVDKTDKIIDAVASPTINKMKNKVVIKDLPKVPVTDEQDELNKISDVKARTFNMTDSSFIGWTTKRYKNDKNSDFAAGNNNERIGGLEQGIVKYLKNNAVKTIKVPQKTEWARELNKLQNTYYVPNGYSLAIEPGDLNKDNTHENEQYKTIQEAIESGEDLHLYANYRKFFNVTVHASYKNIKPDQGEHGKYVNTVKPEKKKAANIGLLTRTAVTPYGKPTVHKDANYYPIKDGIKAWDGTDQDLTWKVPGFDELGQRKSYVSVVVTDAMKTAYENFKVPNWGDLGLKTYLRLNQTDDSYTVDPNAPKNLHENAGNPYGDPLAKHQAYENGVDAYTSATSRKAKTVKHQGTEEVISYEIWNTSTPINIPEPVFDAVQENDKQVKIRWGNAEKAQNIKGIKLTVPGNEEVELVKQDDGTYQTADGNIKAEEEFKKKENGEFELDDENQKIPTGKLIISPLNLEGKAGQDIVAKYVVENADQKTDGPKGRVTIGEQPTSAPVNNMSQIKNKDNGNSAIKFTVPNPTLNKPTKDTVYTAQKWDGNQNKWVDVGSKTLTGDQEMGSEKEIELKNVNDGDIIRIKSEQPGAKPNDSTGTGDKPYMPQKGDENQKYVKLDRAAPITDAKAEDEAFRRFIDLTGTINEIPEGRTIKITIDYKDGNPVVEYDKEITVENKENIIRELNTVLRKGIEDGQIPEIKITAVDRFGNSETKVVDYKESYQLKVFVTGERAGKKFVKVSADKDGADITIKVMNGTNEVASGTAKVTQANQFVKLMFKKDGADYRLKEGDELVIEGTLTVDRKTYTSNPFKLDI